ncbi:MAG: DUF3313 domain-containing protein [Gammaproteobacteria bacterium]|jgi:hypothetical protein|nr:DUF3313 domain-containing protein [Gammaproteobacteria bacterium]
MLGKRTRFRTAALLVVAGLTGACASSPPSIQTGPDAETTFDGLVRVNNTSMNKVWVRPDIDLNSYSKVMPVIAETRYASVRSTSVSVARKMGQDNFALSDDEKMRFQAAVNEIFLAEFAKSQKFQLVDQPGEDVLLVKVELLDVASSVPPQNLGRETIYVRKIGEAGLLLELYDSQSNQVLARASDKREFKYPGDRMELSISGMNANQVKRGLEAWARLMVAGLDSMKTE